MSGKFDSHAFYERLYKLGLDCNYLVRFMPKSDLLREYCTQLIRSSSSVRANYIEALEALSKKDFIHRLKISRKETRESVHWLRFIHDTCNLDESKESMVNLISEGNEIKKILSSSILKLETKQLIGD